MQDFLLSSLRKLTTHYRIFLFHSMVLSTINDIEKLLTHSHMSDQ